MVIFANLALILAKKVSGSLIAEMIISFEPYYLLLSIIALLALIPCVVWLCISQVRKKNNLQRVLRRNALVFISLVLLSSNSLWMGIEVLGFYHPVKKLQISSEDTLKVGFYNKYFPNQNFPQISDELSNLDLDILGMGELKRDQIPYISKLSEYQYSYSEDCICDYPEDVALYSKYPIKNPSTYGLLGSRIIEANIEVQNKDLKIFVVHTTAPMSKREFNLRNQELPELAKLINSKKSDGTIVMGDFNTSPWSMHYKKFQTEISDLKNTAQGFGLRFTWDSEYPLSTHLDHIFLPKNWKIIDSKVEGNYGSDHHLVWARVAF
jgi:endonuclease/exonuclease/phosphatase (EEP) superfamily protein YafD